MNTTAPFIAGDDCYRHVFQHMRYGCACCQVIFDHEGSPIDFIHQEVNAGYLRLTGLNNVVGLKASAVLSDIEHANPGFIEKHLQVAKTGMADQFEIYLEPINKWLYFSLYSPQKGFLIVMLDDISKAKFGNEALQESEMRFRWLFEGHSSIMLVIDSETGNIIDANHAAENFYGWSLEELKMMRIQDINTLPPETVTGNLKTFKRTKQNRFLLQHKRADGSIRDVEVLSNIIAFEGKEVFYSIINDITDQKRAQEELQEVKSRMEITLAAASVGTWDWNVESGEVIIDEMWATIIGYTQKELEPITIKTWIDCVHPDDLVQSNAIIADYFSGKTDEYSLECRMRHKNGEWIWIQDCGKIISRTVNGSPLRMVGTHTDITERKMAEESLRESELRFRTLFEGNPAIMILLDPATGNIIDANQAAAVFYGWPAAIMKQMNVRQINIWPADVLNRTLAEWKFLDQKFFSARHRRADGSVRDIEIFAKKISINGQELLYDIIHDITDRKHAEENLKRSEEQFRKLFENHSAPMLLIDPQSSEILNANAAAANFYGWSHDELCRMKIHQINTLPPDMVRSEMKKSMSGQQKCFSFQHRTASGCICDVEVYSSHITLDGHTLLYSIIHDVTDRKKAEKQLLKQERSLRAINQCNHALLHTENEITLLQKICTIIVNEGGYRMAWVGYVEKNHGKSVSPVASAGFTGKYVQAKRVSRDDVPIGQKAAGSAIREGKACIVHNIQEDPLFASWRPVALQHEFASILSLPLNNADEVFGVLTIYTEKPYAFDTEETMLLTSLSENLAFGINTLRAHKQGAKILKRLRVAEKNLIDKARDSEMKALLLAEKMTQELLERTKELERALEAEKKAGEQQQSFLSMISHEYRTPLAIINGNLDIITYDRTEVACLHTEEVAKMKRAVKRLVELMEISLEESRFKDTMDHTSHRILIAPLIKAELAESAALWPGRFALQLEDIEKFDRYEVNANPQYLKTAFINILDNARKYSPPDTLIMVECRKEGMDAVIRITNESECKTPLDVEGFFNKYHRGSNSSNTSGAGIGLWMTRRIIEQHKGSITMESLPPDMITTVRLPLSDAPVTTGVDQ